MGNQKQKHKMFKLALTLTLAAAIDVTKHGGGGGKGPKPPKDQFDGCQFAEGDTLESVFEAHGGDDDLMSCETLKDIWTTIGNDKKRGAWKYCKAFDEDDDLALSLAEFTNLCAYTPPPSTPNDAPDTSTECGELFAQFAWDNRLGVWGQKKFLKALGFEKGSRKA